MNKTHRRAAILYGCAKKLTNAHKCVSHVGNRDHMPNGAVAQPDYFVRMQVVRTAIDDLSHVLGMAKPREGEILLNTVWI